MEKYQGVLRDWYHKIDNMRISMDSIDQMFAYINELEEFTIYIELLIPAGVSIRKYLEMELNDIY